MVPIIRYAWQRNFAIAPKKVKVHLYNLHPLLFHILNHYLSSG